MTAAAAAPAAAAASGAAAMSSAQEKEEPPILGGVHDLYKLIASYVPKTVYRYTIKTPAMVEPITRTFYCHKVAYAYAICDILRNMYEGVYEEPFPFDDIADGYVRTCLKCHEAEVAALPGKPVPTTAQKRAAYATLYKKLIDPICDDPVELETWFHYLLAECYNEAQPSIKECEVESESDVAAELENFV